MLWLDKYKPTKLVDMINIEKQIKQIKEWLVNLPKSKNQSIIISGNQGLGKSLSIKLLLEELGYNIRINYPNDIKTLRLNNDFNDYYNYNKSVSNLVIESINNKIAIVFDEVENITLSSEKKYIVEINKENNKKKSFPLFFILNNQHSKLVNDLKKNCMEVIYTNPSIEDLRKLSLNILRNEKIKLETQDGIIKIIEFSQFDIRRLINLLQELSYYCVNNIITNTNIVEFISKSREKNIDIGLLKSTHKLLNYYFDYETIMKLYETEKVLLPLMIHKNYLKKIYNIESKDINAAFNMIVQVSDSLSKGDNIETSIYTDQNWYLHQIHGFFTCLNTSYNINKLDYPVNFENIKFASDLNKTSLKNINRKNIGNLTKFINNKSNNEILIISRLCNYFIENKKEDELITILNGYNKKLTIKEIELCIKIDKTNNFYSMTSKDKKRISKLLPFPPIEKYFYQI